MDIAFEILVPKNIELSELSFSQPFYEWDGVTYPQGKEETNFEYFKLIKSEVPKHVLSYLPKSFAKRKWQCIAVTEGLEHFINEQIKNNTGAMMIMTLISLVIGEDLQDWVIVFEPDNDRIDEVFESNVENAADKIVKSLLLERKGYIMWSESR